MELGHNPIKLNARRFYRLGDALRAYAFIKDMMDEKRDRGLRVRYNIHGKLLELGCRSWEQLRYVERQLRSAGHSLKVVDWPTRDFVKD